MSDQLNIAELPELPMLKITDESDFLDAPSLYTQVYCVARLLNEWPAAAALEAAAEAVNICGDDRTCKTVEELNNVTAEVLRTDEWSNHV